MTLRPIVSLLLGLSAVLALAGAKCNRPPPPLRILSPAAGEVVVWMPVDLQVDLAADVDPQTLTVALNGVDVTGWFTLTLFGNRIVATADDVWEDGLLLLGPNQLVATAQGSSPLQVTQQFEASGDPYADAVAAFLPGTRAGHGQAGLPGIILGGPHGLGLTVGADPLEVLSLGIGGWLDLEFVDNALVDGPGVDFTVFENAFLTIQPGLVTGPPFSEPAIVSVSQDGVVWQTFPCAFDPLDAPWHPGCAGVYPSLSHVNDPTTAHPSIPSSQPLQDLVGLVVTQLPPVAGSGGDSFDLADVGLGWARFVRIQASPFDAGLCCEDNAGPDIDAVAAVNSVPGEDLDGNGVPDALE